MELYRVEAGVKYGEWLKLESVRKSEVVLVKRIEGWNELEEYIKEESQKYFNLKHFGIDPCSRSIYSSRFQIKSKLGAVSEDQFNLNQHQNSEFYESYIINARMRYAKWKCEGYPAVVEKCRSKYGVLGLGDLERGQNLKGVQSIEEIPQEYVIVASEKYRNVKFHESQNRLEIERESKLVRGAEKVGVCGGKVVVEYLKEYSVSAKKRYLEYSENPEEFQKVKKEKHEISCEEMSRCVEELYCGLPDEVYKRKQSKKFAVYRRQKLQSERIAADRVRLAECGLRKSRGKQNDHIGTNNAYGNNGFRPFLFNNEHTTFAYTSSITQNHKHRENMIRKYVELGSSAEQEQNALIAAQQLAREKPMFHTRVMNRFT